MTEMAPPPLDDVSAELLETSERRLNRLCRVQRIVSAAVFVGSLVAVLAVALGPFYRSWRLLGSPTGGLSLPLLAFAAAIGGPVGLGVAWTLRFTVWTLLDRSVRRSRSEVRRLKLLQDVARRTHRVAGNQP